MGFITIKRPFKGNSSVMFFPNHRNVRKSKSIFLDDSISQTGKWSNIRNRTWNDRHLDGWLDKSKSGFLKFYVKLEPTEKKQWFINTKTLEVLGHHCIYTSFTVILVGVYHHPKGVSPFFEIVAKADFKGNKNHLSCERRKQHDLVHGPWDYWTYGNLFNGIFFGVLPAMPPGNKARGLFRDNWWASQPLYIYKAG